MSPVQAIAIGIGIVVSITFLVLTIREIRAARQYDLRLAKARAEIDRYTGQASRAPELH